MAADHLQFLKNKFIYDYEEAVEEIRELPFRLHFQKILEVLQEKTINPSTPMILKDWLHDLIYTLTECVILAEKERERKTQNKRSYFSVKKLWFIHKTGKKLVRIESKLQKIGNNVAVESCSSSDLITVHTTPSFPCFPTSYGRTIYGFDGHLQKIEALLLETPDVANRIKVIGIVGMGGVGKTALAQMVFSRVQSQFDFKVWVRLSEKLNPDKVDSRTEIISKILKYFDGTASHASLGDLLRALHHNLLNRRYLIVLDDVWHVSDWYANLDSPLHMDGASNCSHLSHGFPKGSGGAIIFTSRLEEVTRCIVGDEHSLVRLQPTLDAESCWSIFMDSVKLKRYVTFDNVSAMERMKDEIVDNCDGLPLAAITLAEVISYRMGNQVYWSDRTMKKWIHLRPHVHDYLSLEQATEKLRLLPGVEKVEIYENWFFNSAETYENFILVRGFCNPEEIVKQIGKFWFTELILVV